MPTKTRPVPSRFGVRLQQARLREGLSQEGLSKRAGVSDALCGLIESGHVQLSTYPNCLRFARALNVPVTWLLAEEDPALTGDSDRPAPMRKSG